MLSGLARKISSLLQAPTKVREDSTAADDDARPTETPEVGTTAYLEGSDPDKVTAEQAARPKFLETETVSEVQAQLVTRDEPMEPTLEGRTAELSQTSEHVDLIGDREGEDETAPLLLTELASDSDAADEATVRTLERALAGEAGANASADGQRKRLGGIDRRTLSDSNPFKGSENVLPNKNQSPDLRVRAQHLPHPRANGGFDLVVTSEEEPLITELARFKRDYKEAVDERERAFRRGLLDEVIRRLDRSVGDERSRLLQDYVRRSAASREETPDAALKDRTIVELVADSECSNHLRNAISKGAVSGWLPCKTVGDYLKAGASAQEQFMESLPNFGRNVAQELDAIVQNYLAAVKLGSPVLKDASPSDPDTATGARETLIEALLAKGPASVRLTNAFLRGAKVGELPFRTVGEYLDAGTMAQATLMRSLPNFGRKSALELDGLINEYVEKVGRNQKAALSKTEVSGAADGVNEERFKSIVARLAGLTLSDTLKGQDASQRLTNALASPALGERPLTEFFTEGGEYRAELLRQPNFGRTSLKELEALCERAVILALKKDCDDPQEIIDNCALLFNFPNDGSQRTMLAELVIDTLKSVPPRDCRLDQLMSWGMQELPDRELDIILRRYGFGDQNGETLEQISVDYGLTRERIRQLEVKALKRLRTKLTRTPLPELVDKASEHFWNERGVPFIVMEPNDSNQLRREIDPNLALALDVLKLSVGSWLERNSTAMANGYLSRTANAKQIRELGRQIQDRLANQPLPISVSEVLGDQYQDLSLVEAAISLETPYVLFESYLLKDRPRARLKRTIRLHALLSAEKRALTIYQLADLYRERFVGDRCSIRDLTIVMEFSPQLFLEIEEGLWTALGQGGVPNVTNQADHEVEEQTDIDAATIAGSIQEALRERGPSLVGDLYRDGGLILPEGRSRNSIAPILVGRPELFHRILPGVYALPEQVPNCEELIQEPLPFLLNEAQGRAFAFGRMAGEPFGVFPLWVPAAEYRLCKWARFEATSALFHSLLAIAEIDLWPIESVGKSEWKRLAERYGRFELALSGRPLFQEPRPELDRLLAASIIALERGAIGWLQINRIMGRRLDAAGGQSLLALMIALGIVDTPNDSEVDARLRPHPVSRRAVEIVERMMSELVRTGELDWQSPLGQALAAEATSVVPSELGWAASAELPELLQSEGSQGSARDTQGGVDEDPSDDDLISRLIDEHRRTVENDRREKAAQWLLED